MSVTLETDIATCGLQTWGLVIQFYSAKNNSCLTAPKTWGLSPPNPKNNKKCAYFLDFQFPSFWPVFWPFSAKTKIQFPSFSWELTSFFENVQ